MQANKDKIERLYADFLASEKFRKLNSEYSVYALIKAVIEYVLEQEKQTKDAAQGSKDMIT